MDCGPTCLRMIAKYYGKHYTANTLRQEAGFSKQGVSLLSISETAEKIGFRTRGVRISYTQLTEIILPCILHWDQSHFVVLINISKNKAKIADPGTGITTYTHADFLKHWNAKEENCAAQTGIALLIEPTPFFYEQEEEKENKLSWSLISRYLTKSRYQIAQVFISLLVTSLIQLVIPFLTQSIVDTGINTQNLQFVTIVLLAQLMLIISQVLVSFIRSRLLLRTSNTLNLQILSDFWIKLTRLPLSYFDAHHTGDTLQRIQDHNTIQTFLSGQTLNTLFSIFNFIVYAIVLVLYDARLFFIFLVGSLIYFGWIQLFQRIRR